MLAMKRSEVIFTLLIVLFGCGAAFAQSPGPRMPYVDKGACPFECCTYRDWTVDKATSIHRDMSDASPIINRLKKGERVKGLTGTVITTRAGEIRVLKNTKLGNLNLKRGDRLYMLTYLGEGFSKIWYKGRIVEDEAWDEKLFKQLRSPSAVWWVKVRNRKGQTGWSRYPENFGNKDQCGN